MGLREGLKDTARCGSSWVSVGSRNPSFSHSRNSACCVSKHGGPMCFQAHVPAQSAYSRERYGRGESG